MYVCMYDIYSGYHEREGEGDGLGSECRHREHHTQEVAVVRAADTGVQPLAGVHRNKEDLLSIV